MHHYRLFVTSGLHFADSTGALNHIGDKMVSEGVVVESYPTALLEREAIFPTGIALEKHAIAIPHCEATYAVEPAIYLLRPSEPVPFFQADDDGLIAVELIIALIVIDPQEQLELLRTLFAQLQQNEFIEELLKVQDDKIESYFRNRFLHL